MDDLISRAGAIKAICEDGTKLEQEGRYILSMSRRKQRDADILSALPTVDAVPVVRCGKCQYWDSFPSCSATPQYHACRRRIMGNVHTMREDFCSQGERKEDGGEHG